ncbi:MAG: DUF359 domain-containing protein [Methanocellales archaeon]|nr:DUF359 domain-containing protein [Methanocellales archaeon]
MTLRLPEKLREELKKPFGTLYKGNETMCIEDAKRDFVAPTKIISVGDVVTFYLIRSGTIPDIGIVDEMVMRKPAPKEMIEGTKAPEFVMKSVSNPAGKITEELILTIQEAVKSDRPVRVFVKGEEDLAALPAVILAPLASVVIYGQPNEGVVVVNITNAKKDEARALLLQMEGDSWKSRL